MSDRISSLPGPLPTVFYFLISLFPLVIAHELGHFVAAKLCRVKVDEFGIGFPPRLVRVAKVAETEYSINALPLGGFVKLTGEDDPTVPGSFASRGKAVRATVLIAGPVANFALAAVIFASMAWAGLIPDPVYDLDGARVTQVSAGSPAEAAGLKVGDLIIAVNGQPLVGAPDPPPGPDRAALAVSRLVDRTDASAGKPMRLEALRGQMLLIDAATDLANVQLRPDTIVVGDGLSLRGQTVTSAPEGGPLRGDDFLVDRTASGAAALAGLLVLRQPTPVDLTVVPTSSGQGQPARMGVQISAPSVPASYGLVAGAAHGVKFTASVLHAMVTALARMVSGKEEVQLAGPVGISIMSRQMGEQGVVALLEFMALLSLNLGLINLLPFPALDGGRLAFIAAEALRGKRVEPSREAVVHLIGFVLVIGLMGILTLLEVARLTGIGSR